MKETPLTQIHIDLGAKMVEFAGFNMPIMYSGINDEHHQVRNNVGVFDVSHMGEFMVKGPGALDFIQLISTNDASKLFPGKVQYSCMTNDQGGIVDDLLVYMIEENEYMLVVNGANIDKDWAWVNSKNSFDCELTNISDGIALLAVQGPHAAKALQSLTDLNLDEMGYYTFAKGQFAGLDNILISATGYTGAGGFEIYIPAGNAPHVWNSIFADPAGTDIKPIGLAARDTLRLEMGFCLYGNDITDETNPIEAKLGWITKFTKDFNARSIVEDVKTNGASRNWSALN